MDYGSKEPLYVDAEVQTDLTASDIEVMADCKEIWKTKFSFVEHVC